MPEPFRQREVLIKAALEHLQKLKLCIPRVLDIMRQRLLDIANVPSLKVHRARTPSSSEYRHPSVTADVVLPLVGIRMPMQFANCSRSDRNDRGCDCRRDFEPTRIDNRNRTSLRALRNLHLRLAESKILRR